MYSGGASSGQSLLFNNRSRSAAPEDDSDTPLGKTAGRPSLELELGDVCNPATDVISESLGSGRLAFDFSRLCGYTVVTLRVAVDDGKSGLWETGNGSSSGGLPMILIEFFLSRLFRIMK